MKKTMFLFAMVGMLAAGFTSCNNNDDDDDENTANSCIVGKWKTSVNATGEPCDMLIEYKSNGTGTAALLDCSDYCNEVGQGTHANLNYQTFNYTINGNQLSQVVQGQVIVCGTPQGNSNINTTSTFTCSGNTLTTTNQAGSSVTLTRI